MASRPPASGEVFTTGEAKAGGHDQLSPSRRGVTAVEGPRLRTLPSYRTASLPSYRSAVSRTRGNSTEEAAPQWAAPPPAPVGESEAPSSIWPPSAVVEEHRNKATAVWVLLLLAFVVYNVYLVLNSLDKRSNPPVQIQRKEEPFALPDVVFCPSSGDGCDADDGMDCLPMDWRLSAVEGLTGCDKFFATPSPAEPEEITPAPVADDDDSIKVGAPPPASTDSFFSDEVPTIEPTPSPVVLPAIRVSVATTAYDWCPRIPLSACSIDYDGIDAGNVRSLHASFYVLWNDTVSLEPVSSSRRFINMFFVDQDVTDVGNAVVAGRLPYDRVSITGTDSFTFSSNDVVLSMSQYVHLKSNGDIGSKERTYSQATTTAQHTLRLETFEGEVYEGALLYVTLSVNNFIFTSIEEVDPVDWLALLGSAGGVWELVCVGFGLIFVTMQMSGPDKKYRWDKSVGTTGGGKGCGGRWRCCKRCSGCSCAKATS